MANFKQKTTRSTTRRHIKPVKLVSGFCPLVHVLNIIKAHVCANAHIGHDASGRPEVRYSHQTGSRIAVGHFLKNHLVYENKLCTISDPQALAICQQLGVVGDKYKVDNRGC